MKTPFTIRPLTADDAPMVADLWQQHWNAPLMVTRGNVHRPDDVSGFLAEQGDAVAGLVTYHINDSGCEIVTMDSFREGIGIGAALLDAVKSVCQSADCPRIWLVITNDNVAALRFWQKRGFALVTIYRNALDQSRRLKPAIRITGKHGIPLRDEIELEMMLADTKETTS